MFDHKFINDVEIDGIRIFENDNPTCENLAATIYYLLTKFNNNLQYKVKVFETMIGKQTYGVFNPHNIMEE
jgi:6-pyruvoyl-tetrahydropterin synthase